MIRLGRIRLGRIRLGRIRLASLRGRLVAAMFAIFLFGVLADASVHHFEEYTRLAGAALFREPYQDASMLVTFSLAAILLIWAVSFWSLRSLAGAARQAAEAGPANPQARIATDPLPEEVRPLAQAANGALDRLAAAYAKERRFTADAAHELRTPLAVLGLRLQQARAGDAPDWPAIERDLAQMNRLVAQLLDLARKEHARDAAPVGNEPVVNLSRLAREAAASFLPLIEVADRVIAVNLPDRLPVRGRSHDLRDLLNNLLDNALTHGGGTIRIEGRSALIGGRNFAVIEIADEGPGITETLREPVFDRFRKGRQDAPGSGLGLAIVREVVESHDGTVRFLPGACCRVQVALPLAPAGIQAEAGTASAVSV